MKHCNGENTLESYLQHDQNTPSSSPSHDSSNENTQDHLFDPPLYRQRYIAVSELINSSQTKCVMDMGCSEGKFLSHVKENCPFVEELYGLDIDRALLERNRRRIQPEIFDYILKRKNPLSFSLLHGSITQPDATFSGIDFVACIEVIEHLVEKDLEQVPYAIFGELKPNTVVMTTPNCEYNVLFKNFSGMRHWDHKFEWSRQEFESWCNDTMLEYPTYSVEFRGVGEPPVDQKHVGCCSQMAIFRRISSLPVSLENVGNLTTNSTRQCDPNRYDIIEKVLFPYDSRSRTEKVMNEVSYLTNQFYFTLRQTSESEEHVCEEQLCEEDELSRIMPITELLNDVKQASGIADLDVEEFRILLEEHSYVLCENDSSVLLTMKRYYSDDDLIDSYELNDSVEESLSKNCQQQNDLVYEEENWDL